MYFSVYCKFFKNGLKIYPKCQKACFIILNMNLFVTSLSFMCAINFIVLYKFMMKLAALTCCVKFTSQVKSKNNVKQAKLFNLNTVL